MKRRRRSWLASRAANASSNRSSMRFSAVRGGRPRCAGRSSRRGATGPAGDRAGGVAHAVERQQADAHDDQREGADQREHAHDHEPSTSSSCSSVSLVSDSGIAATTRAVAAGLGEHAVVALGRVDGLGLVERDARRQLGLLAASSRPRNSLSRTAPERSRSSPKVSRRRAAAGRRTATPTTGPGTDRPSPRCARGTRAGGPGRGGR